MICDFTSSVTVGKIPITVDFTGRSDGTPTSWFWRFGDDQTSTLKSPQHFYNKIGTKTVTLEARDASNYAVKKAIDYVQILPLNIPVRFQNLIYGVGSPLSHIDFNFGDGTTITTTAAYVNHTYAAIGDYTATITASTIDATVSTQTYVVPVRTGASAPGPFFLFGSTWGVLPNSPSNLRASTSYTNRINLDWTDNASSELGFKIERSSDRTTFAQIISVAKDSTRYDNTGLGSSLTYWYRIRAYNNTGDSSYSNDCSGRTI